MLHLVGIGMKVEDISLGAIGACKSCEHVFMESYTSIFEGSVKDIENLIGRRVIVLERGELEEKSERILNLARKKDVCVLVPGDPLIATTHVSLLLDAEKMGIKCNVVHAPSIITCIGRTGLQIYKFGRTVSIPAFTEIHRPESFYERMLENLKNGMHSLILIDVKLKPRDALLFLLEVDEKREKILKDRKILLCSKLSQKGERIIFGGADEILPLAENVKHPACIVIPSELHFMEEDFLKKFEASQSPFHSILSTSKTRSGTSIKSKTRTSTEERKAPFLSRKKKR